MKLLGFLLYYVLRMGEKLWETIWKFALAGFISRTSRSCGSIHFSGYARISNSKELTLGQNIQVNKGAWWACGGGLWIGDNCHFAKNCTIYTHNHNYHGNALPYDEINLKRPVKIHRNVWVGANVTILPGTEIGEGAIIGAGSVVFGEIASFSIVGAASTVKIKERDIDHYRKLDAQKLYGNGGRAKN